MGNEQYRRRQYRVYVRGGIATKTEISGLDINQNQLFTDLGAKVLGLGFDEKKKTIAVEIVLIDGVYRIRSIGAESHYPLNETLLPHLSKTNGNTTSSKDCAQLEEMYKK